MILSRLQTLRVSYLMVLSTRRALMARMARKMRSNRKMVVPLFPESEVSISGRMKSNTPKATMAKSEAQWKVAFYYNWITCWLASVRGPKRSSKPVACYPARRTFPVGMRRNYNVIITSKRRRMCSLAHNTVQNSTTLHTALNHKARA